MRYGSMRNCLWGHALKMSPGINRRSRVSYSGPGFLSSATWPSLPKKHFNGLNQPKSDYFIFESIDVQRKATLQTSGDFAIKSDSVTKYIAAINVVLRVSRSGP